MRVKHGEAPTTETSLPQAEGKQAEIDSMGSPAVLKPISNEPLTLHMTEDAKVVYQSVGRAAASTSCSIPTTPRSASRLT